MSAQHYSKDEIKKMYRKYRTDGNWDITNKEFDIICSSISNIPKDIVDKIYKEVYIAALSLRRRGKRQSACYVNLESKDIKNIKGIIFLSPLVFNDSSKDFWCFLH